MSELCPKCQQPLPVTKLGLQIDAERSRLAFPNGQMLRLQPDQMRLMLLLAENTVVSVAKAMECLYGRKHKQYSTAALRVRMSNLRRHLEPFGFTITKRNYELKRVA